MLGPPSACFLPAPQERRERAGLRVRERAAHRLPKRARELSDTHTHTRIREEKAQVRRADVTVEEETRSLRGHAGSEVETRGRFAGLQVRESVRTRPEERRQLVSAHS